MHTSALIVPLLVLVHGCLYCKHTRIVSRLRFSISMPWVKLWNSLASEGFTYSNPCVSKSSLITAVSFWKCFLAVRAAALRHGKVSLAPVGIPHLPEIPKFPLWINLATMKCKTSRAQHKIWVGKWITCDTRWCFISIRLGNGEGCDLWFVKSSARREPFFSKSLN